MEILRNVFAESEGDEENEGNRENDDKMDVWSDIEG